MMWGHLPGALPSWLASFVAGFFLWARIARSCRQSVPDPNSKDRFGKIGSSLVWCFAAFLLMSSKSSTGSHNLFSRWCWYNRAKSCRLSRARPALRLPWYPCLAEISNPIIPCMLAGHVTSQLAWPSLRSCLIKQAQCCNSSNPIFGMRPTEGARIGSLSLGGTQHRNANAGL